MIAALFVEPNGVYAGLPDVDVWDEARDARLYDGPYPVVAHPPCERWSLMGLCRGYYDGHDDGCFESALRAVRAYGGVLEHPRHSLAWRTFGLARPAAAGWTRSLIDDGWTCEVDQWHYDHEARKPTWLYYVGASAPPALRWYTGDATLSAADHGGGKKGRVRGSRPKRSATPPGFRDALLDLARLSVEAHRRADEVAA
jgi:hypothetical protein